LNSSIKIIERKVEFGFDMIRIWCNDNNDGMNWKPNFYLIIWLHLFLWKKLKKIVFWISGFISERATRSNWAVLEKKAEEAFNFSARFVHLLFHALNTKIISRKEELSQSLILSNWPKPNPTQRLDNYLIVSIRPIYRTYYSLLHIQIATIFLLLLSLS